MIATPLSTQLTMRGYRDTRGGLSSLLIAADRDIVTKLNARARGDLVVSGDVSANGVPLSDGTAWRAVRGEPFVGGEGGPPTSRHTWIQRREKPPTQFAPSDQRWAGAQGAAV